MALIICPECNKEISDMVDSCPYCGFPINKKEKQNICIINNIPIDLTETLKYVFNEDIMMGIVVVRNLTNCGLVEAKNLCDIIKETGKIPKIFNMTNTPTQRECPIVLKRDVFQPHCPTCSSTNVDKISGLERGASVLTLGLFSKKINKSFKCKNCGMTW